MTLEKLLTKNKIILPEKVLALCDEGISLMEKSIDPLHNKGHIERIFSNLDCFLEKEQIEKSKINFQTLILSICWHDVWKSDRFPGSVFWLLFDRLTEGIGSMKIFSQQAKKVGLEKSITNAVSYSIRKHSDVQLLPTGTLEARILKDVDTLDEWSLPKLRRLEKIYLHPRRLNPGILKLAQFYFEHFMAKKSASSLNFTWSKKEFEKRKKPYLEEVDRLFRKYGDKLN